MLELAENRVSKVYRQKPGHEDLLEAHLPLILDRSMIGESDWPFFVTLKDEITAVDGGMVTGLCFVI